MGEEQALFNGDDLEMVEKMAKKQMQITDLKLLWCKTLQ
jgi:hypothetical protein